MVEPPGGSPLRKLAAFGRKRYMFKDNVNGDLCGGGFLHECRNKQSITLDLTKEEGRAILKKLVIHADVLVENYAPGQFDEWGIGYRQLSKINPRLIYVWNGQKGQWGPLKDKPGRTLSVLALFHRLVPCHRAAQELRRHPHPGRRTGRRHPGRQPDGPQHHRRPDLPGNLRQRPVHRSHLGGVPPQDP